MPYKKQKPVWFCSRENGMSFYPVTWQGYVVLVLYVLLLSISSLAISRSWGLFIGIAVALTVVVLGLVSAMSDDSVV